MRVEQLTWIYLSIIMGIVGRNPFRFFLLLHTLFIYLENLFDLALVWAEPPLEEQLDVQLHAEAYCVYLYITNNLQTSGTQSFGFFICI
jgi:hypothetical protein